MTLQERERDFKLKIQREISFPQPIRDEFFEYWTEPNKSGSKMRWELEKTWDLKRRLQRWARTSKVEIKPVNEMNEGDKEVNYLNERLSDYARHPTSFSSEALQGLYDYLKDKKLMKLNKVQIDIAREAGPEKGKGLAVKMFFENMINRGITFKELMHARP